MLCFMFQKKNIVLDGPPHPINDSVPTTPACTWWNHPEEDLSSSVVVIVWGSVRMFVV